MRRRRSSLPLAILGSLGSLVVLGAGLVACAGDPARRVEAARARYDATLQSFVLRDDPASGRQEILLDVLVGWQGGAQLPGLTLDISMADAAGKEKAHRRQWIDVSGVGRGGAQISLVLADLSYQPGDGFFVEVRGPVPAAERSAYREFGASGTP